jgi:hypothetical protein
VARAHHRGDEAHGRGADRERDPDRGLSKRYDDRLALDALDLTVEPGEVYG